MSEVIIRALAAQAATLINNDIETNYGGSEAFRKTLNKKPHAIDFTGEFLFDVAGLTDRINLATDKNKDNLTSFYNRYTKNFSATNVLNDAKKVIALSMAKAVKSSASKGITLRQISGRKYAVVNNFAAAKRIIFAAMNHVQDYSSKYPDAVNAIYNVYYPTNKNVGDKNAGWDIDIGHLFASSTVGRSNVDLGYISEKIDRNATEAMVESLSMGQKMSNKSAIQRRINNILSGMSDGKFKKQYVEELLSKNNKVDVQIEFEKAVGASGVKASLAMDIVFVGPQSTQLNQAYGSMLAAPTFGPPLDNYIKKLENRFTEIKSSPSISEMVDELIDDALTKGKVSTKKTNTKSRVSRAIKAKTQKRPVSELRPDLAAYRIAVVNIKGNATQRLKQGNKFASIQGLIAQINNELHDRIRANMGKGNAKAVLNYRSGRFANSVNL